MDATAATSTSLHTTPKNQQFSGTTGPSRIQNLPGRTPKPYLCGGLWVFMEFFSLNTPQLTLQIHTKQPLTVSNATFAPQNPSFTPSFFFLPCRSPLLYSHPFLHAEGL
jgi:hypothetical protein